MLEQDTPGISPEHLLQLKNEVLERWQPLPPAHRASMALVLLQDVLAGDYGPWLVDALVLQGAPVQAALDAVYVGDEETQPRYAPLDQATLERLPLTFTAEGERDEALAHIKLVLPGDSRVWYASAFDRQDLLFGLIVETEIRSDYFSLAELRALQGADGQGVRHDLSYTPRSLADLQTLYEQRRTE